MLAWLAAACGSGDASVTEVRVTLDEWTITTDEIVKSLKAGMAMGYESMLKDVRGHADMYYPAMRIHRSYH